MELLVALIVLGLIGVLIGGVLGIIAFAQSQRLDRQVGELKRELQRLREQTEAPKPLTKPQTSVPLPVSATVGVVAAAHEMDQAPVVLGATADLSLVMAERVPEVMPTVTMPLPKHPDSEVAVVPMVAELPPVPLLVVAGQAAAEVAAEVAAVPLVAARREGAPSSAASRPSPSPVSQAIDFEGIVGKRWLTWSGIALVFLAGVFFLKYAYDQDWLGQVITPPVRIAGIAAVALAMLITGLRLLTRGMPAIGHGLAGGAVALAYLAVYAGKSPALMMVPEPLFPGVVAFVLMAMISAAGIALAVRYEALAMAICATVGGFATPILCSTGDGSREGLFTYVLLLDLGVLGAAWWRRWRALDLLAFIGTVALYMGWYHTRMTVGASPWGMLAWLGIFHVVFLVLPFAHHWRTRSVVTIERFALALGNLAFTLAYAALMLRVDHQMTLALSCLGLAAVYAGIGAVTRQRVGEDQRVIHGFLGLGAMLLTLGVLYVMPVEAVATAWAVEAAVLLALGYRFAHRPTRVIAHVVLVCAVARLWWKMDFPLTNTTPSAWLDGDFIVNRWLLALLVAPLGAAACAVVHRWLGRSAEDRVFQIGCWWVAGGLLLLTSGDEIIRHHLGHPGAWQWLPPVSALGAWWSIGALGFLAAAWRWTSSGTAQLALVPAVAGVVLGIASYALAWPGGVPVVNPRCLSAVITVGVLVVWMWVVSRWVVVRGRERLGDTEIYQPTLLVIAQLATVLLATLETCSWFGRHDAPAGADPHLALCAVWGFAAVVSIVAATALRSPLIAKLGVLPLMLAVVASAALYLRDSEPVTLAANGRFLVAGLAVFAFGLLRLPFPTAAWLPTATHLLATAFISAEVVRWSSDHFMTAAAMRYGTWSVSLVWSVSALGGFIRWQRGAGPGAVQLAVVLAIGAALTALTGYALNWQGWMPFLNQQAVAPLSAIATLVVGWRIIRIRPFPGITPAQCAWTTAAVFFLACTCEPAAWFINNIADQDLAHRLSTFSITVMWLVLASGALYVGFRRRLRVVRFAALGLFALTAVKLLQVDMSGMQQLYRILAFLLTGVVLLVASYVYHRLERQLMVTPDPAPPDRDGERQS